MLTTFFLTATAAITGIYLSRIMWVFGSTDDKIVFKSTSDIISCFHKGVQQTKCAFLASSLIKRNRGSNFVIRNRQYYLRQAFRLPLPPIQALNAISQGFLERSAENLRQVDMMPFFLIIRNERNKAKRCPIDASSLDVRY